MDKEKKYQLNRLFYQLVNELHYLNKEEYIKSHMSVKQQIPSQLTQIDKIAEEISATAINQSLVKYTLREQRLLMVNEEFEELMKGE